MNERFEKSGDRMDRGDRGDRGECFPTETHGVDMKEVVGVFDLARGVTGDGEQHIVGMNAFAVIDDTDEFAPPFDDIDLNARGKRIETVLHQLFDDTGGTFDHFARGDLVDDVSVELINAGHNSVCLCRPV